MNETNPNSSRGCLGTVLISIGVFLLIAFTIGFYILDGVGCAAFNTSGTPCEFQIYWPDVFELLTIPMALAAGLVWLGMRLRR
jgi:uncharacterized membrane protein